MNFIKKIFGIKEPEKTNEDKEELTEIKESDFIDNSEPNENRINLIEFGTKMPIDIIYSYLKEDYEFKGYNDALTSPDTSYRDLNISKIKSELEIKFRQVNRKYEDTLKILDFHIQSRGDAGLTDIVELLKNKKEICLEHLEDLKQMQADLNNEAKYIMGIFDSYNVGFIRGLASLSLHNLNIE